jgi:hypothetical protein
MKYNKIQYYKGCLKKGGETFKIYPIIIIWMPEHHAAYLVTIKVEIRRKIQTILKIKIIFISFAP